MILFLISVEKPMLNINNLTSRTMILFGGRETPVGGFGEDRKASVGLQVTEMVIVYKTIKRLQLQTIRWFGRRQKTIVWG